MYDFIISDVPQCLRDRKDQKKLSDHGQMIKIGMKIGFEITKEKIVHYYCIGEETIFIDNNIVFG